MRISCLCFMKNSDQVLTLYLVGSGGQGRDLLCLQKYLKTSVRFYVNQYSKLIFKVKNLFIHQFYIFACNQLD